jgi:hypothetical protein
VRGVKGVVPTFGRSPVVRKGIAFERNGGHRISFVDA